MARKKSSQPGQEFLEPCTDGASYLRNRDEWIDEVTSGFATTAPANREIYRRFLETLWPEGHGIPGPIVHQDDLRMAIDDLRSQKGKPPYKDPFRRLRELQGNEGLLGIIKNGNSYQLIHLNISPKKSPRVALSQSDWDKVLEKYKRVCAVCGDSYDEKDFWQDHKIPRQRGGTDDITNWQPLCASCNIEKSVLCRGCNKDCAQCSWAYPEYYKPLRLSSKSLKSLNELARRKGKKPSELVSDWIYATIKL